MNYIYTYYVKENKVRGKRRANLFFIFSLDALYSHFHTEKTGKNNVQENNEVEKHYIYKSMLI